VKQCPDPNVNSKRTGWMGKKSPGQSQDWNCELPEAGLRSAALTVAFVFVFRILASAAGRRIPLRGVHVFLLTSLYAVLAWLTARL
jgi:hypothetical protein